MIVKKIEVKKEFEPFTISLTFETQTEVEMCLSDIEDAIEEEITFNELNELYQILKQEMEKPK